MEAKHTKGNWIAKDGQIYVEETGETLALITYFDKDNEEKKANARLIAAAPDMLEALKKLLVSMPVPGRNRKQAEAELMAIEAIKKATE